MPPRRKQVTPLAEINVRPIGNVAVVSDHADQMPVVGFFIHWPEGEGQRAELADASPAAGFGCPTREIR